MRIAIAGLAAALVAGLGGTVMADASPSSTSGEIIGLAWSPDGKWLAYVVDIDRGALGVQVLRVVRVDRGVQRDVVTTSPTGELAWITWAPDSKKFAVREYEHSTSSYSALISSANGRRVRRFGGGFTDWSPDSRDFLVEKDGSTYIVNSVTRAERFLVEGGGALWSPNGTRIAFSATTQQTRCGGDYDYRLFSVNTNGAGRVQLGTDRYSFTVQFAAAWAPDSSRIAYYEGTTFECYRDHGVVIVPADGSKQAVELGDYSGAISWSPTGARLATRNLLTSELRILTPSGVTQATIPSIQEYGWAPNGARVVFKSFETARPAAIYVEPIDGSSPRVIAATGDHPAWSKLGWIAYSNRGSCKGGGDRVFVVRPNGKHRHALSRCRSKS